MNKDERESESVELEPFEGDPDFDESPTTQKVDDKQDEEASDA